MRIVRVVTVFVAVCVLAGCGDSDSDGNRTAAPTVASTATRTAGNATPTNVPTAPASPTTVATGTLVPASTFTPPATATPTPMTTQRVSNPKVEGPIVSPGSPWIQSTSFDLAEVGYQQAEYFITGTAISYANDGEFAS